MNAIETRRGTRIDSPKELEEILVMYPLNRDFIEWVAKDKWVIHYSDYYKTEKWFGKLHHKFGLIMINPNQTKDELNTTLVHELIHIAIPNMPWWVYTIERKIDKIAKTYLHDKVFIDYIKSTIPIIEGPLFDNR